MKLLVCGGAGFIGSNFILHMLETNPEITLVNYDKLTYAGNLDNLTSIAHDPRYTFEKGDITDLDRLNEVIKKYAVTNVINFAAESIPENIYIPIKSNTGTKILTFKELWEQQKRKNIIKKTEKGEVIFLRGKQTKALSFLNGGQWMPIKAITRHLYKGKIIKLNQKWGTIEATPNHSIYSANLELVSPQDNLEILVIRTINENNKKFKKAGRILLEVLAAYITEGNATFNKANGEYIVEISQKDKQWLEEIGEKIKTHFGYSYNIVKNNTWYRLQLANKEFYTYLIKECGRYSNYKFFPNWIFDCSNEDREYFWSKLLEGDGTKDGRYCTTSFKLANQISLLLTLQRKFFTVFERNPAKNKTSWEFKTKPNGFHYGLNQRKKIEIDYEGWVYDLEIEQTHKFACGIGNVVCHNTHVDRSIHGGAKEFVLTNTLGVQMILDAVRFNKIEKFINVSTDEVYGSLRLDENRKFTEDTPIWPNMPYAAAKAGGDLMCNAYFVTHKVPVIVTHCSNNYGPYQFPEKLIPFFVFKLLKGEKVPVYGDGLNVRDWIHARDHAKALDLLLQKGKPGEVYNIGVDNERSNLEVTKMILEIMGFGEDRIEYVTDRPGHDRRYAIDATKIMSLGWRPDYPREKFEQGLRETIEWYKHNTAWVEHIWERKKDEMNKFQENLERSTEKQKAATE